jgi:hypothetical protein
MGRFIVKLQQYYFEYSTIVDAPVTFGMDLKDFKAHYRKMNGLNSMRDLKDRLVRVESKGTSSLYHDSAEDVLSDNRAGPKESSLSVDELYTAYCLRQPIRDGWIVPIVKDDD